MAATKLISGILREIWQEGLPGQAGGPSQVFTTGIRIDPGSLSKVRALLVVDSVVGGVINPAVTADAPNGFLRFSVAFSGNPAVVVTWTLDAQLTHSIQQARDPSAGAYIAVVNGAGVVGLLGNQTLAQTYDFGAVAADQRMVIDTAIGGGVVIEASTAAVTANGVSFEIRQNAAWSVPMRVVRAGNDAVGADVQFSKSRGTIPAPTSVVTNDALGDINYYGNFAGVTAVGARVRALCTAISEGVWDTAIDIYAARANTLVQSWRFDRETLTAYGIRDDANGSTIQFRKGRGTNAAPVVVQAGDLLGEVDFYGFNVSFNRYAHLTVPVLSMAGGVTTGIDIYAAYNSVEARAFQIRLTSGGGGILDCIGDGLIQPNVNDQGQLGSYSGNSWHSIAVYTAYITANVLMGTNSASGANRAVVFSNDATIPAPVADKVIVGSKDFVFGANHAVLDIAAEELVLVVAGPQNPTTFIPIRYNGISYYLYAEAANA